MTRRGQVETPERWLEHRQQHGGHRLGFEVLNLLIQPAEYLGWVTAEQRVGAQRVAQPAHDVGGHQTAAHHVADHNAQPAGRKCEDVIPVTANPAAARWNVVGSQFEPRHYR